MKTFLKFFGGTAGIVVALGIAFLLFAVLCAGCLLAPGIVGNAREAARRAHEKQQQTAPAEPQTAEEEPSR